MTFEDAMASLGDELGLPLEIEDGKAGFVASFDDDGEEPVSVEISDDGDEGYAVVSADLGKLPSDDIEAFATRMLEANHLFAGTGGAALAVDGDRVLLERRVRIDALARGEGANVMYPFVDSALAWRRNLLGGVTFSSPAV